MMTGFPDGKAIGRSLQRARKNAGFKSAQAFAEHIGMKASAYTEYEQGRRAFSYEQAWIMADALKCSMDELGGRDWPPEPSGNAPEIAELARIYDKIDDSGKRAVMMNARAAVAEYAPASPVAH